VDLSQNEWVSYFHPPLNPLPSREGKKRNTHEGIPLPLWEGVRGRGIYPLEIRNNQNCYEAKLG
jgi:hypothetical protein